MHKFGGGSPAHGGRFVHQLKRRAMMLCSNGLGKVVSESTYIAADC